MAGHDDIVARTADAAHHPAAFAAAFGSGDPVAVEAMYEQGAILVPEPGSPVTGAHRVAANERFLALGLPMRVRPRHVYVVEDIALMIVDWTIEGAGPDGEPVRIEGTATDVARRGADGTWRYVIDNPFGVA
ncbi:YybH family protein [Actinoplanes sp. NPDC000266]